MMKMRTLRARGESTVCRTMPPGGHGERPARRFAELVGREVLSQAASPLHFVAGLGEVVLVLWRGEMGRLIGRKE